MSKRARRIVRLLVMAGIILGCAGLEAIAAHLIPPSSYSDRPVRNAPPQFPQNMTGKLMHAFRLDGDNRYAVNMVTRAAVLSGTGVMAIWFVIGGVPRRKRRSSLLQLTSAAELANVLETPRLHHRPTDIFHRAFTESVAAPRVSVQLTPPPNMTSSATVLELMSEPALLPELVETPTQIAIAVDAVVDRTVASDDALMAEVQQYARELLSGVPRESNVHAVASPGEMVAAAQPAALEVLAIESIPAAATSELATAEMMSEIPTQVAPASTSLLPLSSLDEEDILGLGELVVARPVVQTSSTFNELFEAVTTVQNASPSAVDAYEVILGEFAPLPDELPEPPMDPRLVAHLVPRPASAGSAPLLDQRVVVIGESDAVIEVEKRILISASARVIGFRNFVEAVRFADEKDFDLLLINGMTEDGWSAPSIHDWLAENRSGWEHRAAFALSAPDPASDEFAARTGAWCIVHPFGPKELVSFLCAVLAPPEDMTASN